MAGPKAADDLSRSLAGGTIVNVLGSAAKALHPLFLILATRLFGPEAVGLYLLGTAMIRFTGGFVSAGYRSGVVMVGGRREDPEAHETQRALVNAFAIVLGLSIVTVGAVWLFAKPLLALYNEQYVASGLADAIGILVFGLPALAIAEISIAGTRALRIMRYDALLIGGLKPALLVVFALLAYAISPDLTGLCWAYVAAHVALALACLVAMFRHFSPAGLVRTATHFEFDRELTAFAIPQSLNMSLTYFISDVDLLMLGAFGADAAQLALYSIGAQIIRNVRQIKLAVSGAFAPVIASLHQSGKLDELAHRIGVLSRWLVVLALPAVVVVVTLRSEILWLFDEAFGALPPEDTYFMLVLCGIPLLSSAFGLAGNTVVMTGHARWNLINSITVGIVNIGLNALLIPRYGLMGAAAGSLVASVVVTVMQVVEVRRLLGIRPPIVVLFRPFVAGTIATAVGIALLSLVPAGVLSATGLNFAAAASALLIYVGTLRVLGFDAEDLAAFREARLS